MNFVHEYALLVAVALPVLIILGMQVFLFRGGERGTLLLPGFKAFPTVGLAEGHEKAVVEMPAQAPTPSTAANASTNDEFLREAA
ncbi:MAG TPA: hypothetical protein VN878_08640 [Usitatibacter sp.]|nr:hypothetical protein [Usitatibacter sp.]